MSEKKIVLPFEAVPAASLSPESLLIYSKPKTGKTTLASGLPKPYLILDFEKGSRFLDSVKMEINDYKTLRSVCKEVIKQGRPYEYGIIDTATKFEEIVEPLAEQLYMATPQGKNWIAPHPEDATKLHPECGKAKYGSILAMPNGAGYFWTKKAFLTAYGWIKKAFPKVIIFAHVKDVTITKESGEISALDVNLTGKLKTKIASEVDGVGFLYRKGNSNILSFKVTEEAHVECRAKHLRGKQIEISSLDEDGNYTAHWDKVFID